MSNYRFQYTYTLYLYLTPHNTSGPGALIAVGYMDPGNWSTDIAGGSAFGYSLLFIIMLSSLMAMFLQNLAAKLGLATKRDLAQACRDSYPEWARYILWIIAEIAIMATDIAEVIGSAVAFKLLFGLPLFAGVLITACDVLVLLFFGNRMRWIEILVGVLVSLITVCFAVQIGLSDPSAGPLLIGKMRIFCSLFYRYIHTYQNLAYRFYSIRTNFHK